MTQFLISHNPSHSFFFNKSLF